MTAQHIIEVLVVHEFPLMCDIIAKVVDDEHDIHVQAYASSITEAEKIVLSQPVDIVLISPRLPDNGTIKLTKTLMQKKPSVKVLVLGISETREQVLQYIEAGATGYVVRENSINDLLSVIRATYNGQAIISPEIALALIHRVKIFSKSFIDSGLNPPDIQSLTKREIEIFCLIGQNKSNLEIAEKVYVSPGTIKNHVHNILKKLDATNRQDLIAMYHVYSANWQEGDQ